MPVNPEEIADAAKDWRSVNLTEAVRFLNGFVADSVDDEGEEDADGEVLVNRR